ncbi:MAG: hypothetical protein GX968_05605 [Tissierellia bacterium]|nr:hypothetical protein [Tissierellia bacterium]
MELYRPVIIPQLIGLALGLFFSYLLGKKEKERLGHLEVSATIDDEYSMDITDEEKALRRPKLVILNVILIVVVIAIMISGLILPAASFMIGTAIALVLNYPNSEDQKIRINSHAETAKAFGVPVLDIARASIIGQITVGFPISPLTPSTFLLVGLAGVELGEHQKFSFKYLYAISVVIIASMLLMGVLNL